MNLEHITPFLVVRADGSVNYDESYHLLWRELFSYEMLVKERSAVISDQVNRLFDESQGSPLKADYVASIVASRIDISPCFYRTIKKTCSAYLAKNTGKVDTGALFGFSRKVGIYRHADRGKRASIITSMRPGALEYELEHSSEQPATMIPGVGN